MSLLLWIGMFFGFQPQSQDTVALAQVDVYAPALDRFAQGQKVENYSKSILSEYSGRSLGDLLQETSPIFIRQYGPSMLATPSFRGTSGGHTAIFWNGLPINSPSLGQSDLSIYPVQAFDKVQAQFGSSGALFGNEAIGGSIHLGSQSDFDQGLQLNINQQFGSFGMRNTGLSVGFSSQKVSLQSKFYSFKIQNDFPFRDLGQPETPMVNQDHAAVKQTGFVQDFAWNLKPNQQIKASYWWSRADREIQPVMGSTGRDEQEDENHRMVLDYFFFGENSTLNLKTGFVLDRQLFNRSSNDTDQYFLSGDWDKTFNEKWSVKTGVRYTRAVGNLSTYQATDTRLELYQSLRFLPSEKVSLSVNFRELAYQGGGIPISPSLGMDWKLRNASPLSIILKTSLGRGFKVPTLNDRFWEPVGNPDLLPEESWSGEIGLHFSREGQFSWTTSVTYYRMEVDNWIIWLPKGNVWSPENLREVQNQGLEYLGNLSRSHGPWNFSASWSYTWSKAIITEGLGESDQAIGKQLPYTPEHQANGRIEVSHAGLSVFVGTFYVGERRVTSDGGRSMLSYQLFNLGLNYENFHWGQVKIPLRFQVNNLFNTEYQVLYLRPMPGRSYQLSFSIQL